MASCSRWWPKKAWMPGTRMLAVGALAPGSPASGTVQIAVGANHHRCYVA
jgi:hypothetical protein